MRIKFENQKVLVVNPTSVYGGGEVYLYNLLRQVPKNRINGFRVLCACDRLKEDLSSLGFKVIKIKDATRLSFNTLRLVCSINNVIKSFSPNMVFLNGLAEIGVYSNYIRSKKIFCVAHSNEYWLAEKANKNIFHFIKRVLILNFDKGLNKLIFVNNLAKNNSLGYGKLFDKSVVVYNGVPKIIPRIAKRDKFVFGRIGRLVKGKGNDILLMAFAKYIKESTDPSACELIFAGEGDDLLYLKELALELGISGHVNFVGLINQSDFFSMVDLMVSPSLMEATPLVIAEAMSSFTPVIATAVGGCPEMITHQFSGLLIPPKDTGKLCSAMQLLSSDQALADRLASNAYIEYEKRFSTTAMMKSLSGIGIDFWSLT